MLWVVAGLVCLVWQLAGYFFPSMLLQKLYSNLFVCLGLRQPVSRTAKGEAEADSRIRQIAAETGTPLTEVPYSLVHLQGLGCSIAYTEYGDRTSPHVIFYHHGWPGSRVGAMLADKDATELGLRIIAMERPGYGRTPFFPYNMKQWADIIRHLADHLGVEKFSILGASGGSAFASACAFYIPRDRLLSLTLVAPLGKTDISICYRLLFWTGDRLPFCWLWLFRLARGNTIDASSVTRRFTAMVDQRAMQDYPESGGILRASTAEGLRQGPLGWCYDAGLLRNSWGFDLADIKLKHVYLWHGKKDWTVPKSSVQLFERIPNMQPIYLQEEGHLSISIRQLGSMMAKIKQAHEELLGAQ